MLTVRPVTHLDKRVPNIETLDGVGSVLATPCALVSFGLYPAVRKRAGAPPRLAAMLGSAVGAVLGPGAAAMTLLTP